MIMNSLLIAAGLSSRMGKFKPLLPYNDEPIIMSVIKKIVQVSNRVFIVTGYREKEITITVKEYFQGSQLNEKITFVSNRTFEIGMFSSLQKGLEAGKECDWLLYHFVDQPKLPHKFYNDFISEINNKFDWIQPSFKDKKGHPVLIKNSLFKNIIEADENSSLKELVNSKIVKKKIWDCSYEEILSDIDTPKDYNELLNSQAEKEKS
jgi:molybdenum cofactor cytidylyltransferase